MSTDIYHVNVRFILLPSSYSFNTLIAERDDKFLKMGWGVRHEQRCVFIIFSVNNRKGEKQLRAWIWMWKIARVHFSFLLFPCEKLWLCEIWGGGDFENLCLDSGHTIRVKFIYICNGGKPSCIYTSFKSKQFKMSAHQYYTFIILYADFIRQHTSHWIYHNTFVSHLKWLKRVVLFLIIGTNRGVAKGEMRKQIISSLYSKKGTSEPHHKFRDTLTTTLNHHWSLPPPQSI